MPTILWKTCPKIKNDINDATSVKVTRVRDRDLHLQFTVPGGARRDSTFTYFDDYLFEPPNSGRVVCAEHNFLRI